MECQIRKLSEVKPHRLRCRFLKNTYVWSSAQYVYQISQNYPEKSFAKF